MNSKKFTEIDSKELKKINGGFIIGILGYLLEEYVKDVLSNTEEHKKAFMDGFENGYKKKK